MASTKPTKRVCPRCDLCSKAIRISGLGKEGVWCKVCISSNLPFTSILSERDYREALREFREGIGTGGEDFDGARFNPFG